MNMKSVIEVSFPDEKSARAAEKALSHEGLAGSRSRSEIKRKGRTITVFITADDAVAMRATMNAFMREFQVFESLEKGKI
jgi:tRNA threonylcarbamoyladenosine modification (KEOPS) complex  Pcc1 subunit